MKYLWEEMSVKCVNKNERGFVVGQNYEVVEIEYDKQNNISKIKCCELEAEWLNVDEFNSIFELPYSFEEHFIDPILTLMKDHQEYLTIPENLTQLAKLGYMYNTLWYIGRVCWGYDGVVEKGNSCENNPKYKIDEVEPINEEIENLVYDAWGMHVSNDYNDTTFKQFVTLIREGRKLSDFELKSRKVNKTFDEWVEILTDPQYKYSSIYPDRRSVANHLLCVIGNGYGYNKAGYVTETASGADQDIDLYGTWENAKFREDINLVVESLLENPVLKQTLDASNAYITKVREDRRIEEEKKEKARNKKYGDLLDLDIDELLEKLKAKDPEKFNKISKSIGDTSDMKAVEQEKRTWYPICSYSAIYDMFNPECEVVFEKSYMDEAISICKDIIENEAEESNNVEFAKKSLARIGYKEYEDSLKDEFCKYELFDKIKSKFEPLLAIFPHSDKQIDDTYSNLSLNDTKDSKYNDNNYYITINLSKQFLIDNDITLKHSISVELFKGQTFYEDMKNFVEYVSEQKGVQHVFFSFDKKQIYIKVDVKIKPSYVEDLLESEADLISKGFDVSNNTLSFEIGDYTFVTNKTTPLGRTHPNSESLKDYFSQAKSITVFNKEYKKVFDFRIDERNYNTFSYSHNNKKLESFIGSIESAFTQFKASDPDYGNYDSNDRDNTKEGKRCLYVHDFLPFFKTIFENPLDYVGSVEGEFRKI